MTAGMPVLLQTVQAGMPGLRFRKLLVEILAEIRAASKNH
jgi:hypothetical protein